MTNHSNDRKKNEMFLSWNIATSKSLINQIDISGNDYHISMLKNRLEVMKSYIGVDDFASLNTNSIRYKFISNYKDWGKEYYIIEDNKNGEKISLFAYVICCQKQRKFEIYKYEYKKEFWVKISKYSLDDFQYVQEKYRTSFGKGENENDIIVTHFKKGKVITSDYFLINSMKIINLK